MAEANWYVVHTYSGYENKVKANIEKTIENRHLEEEILEVRVPMEDVVEMKNGARKTVQKKLFPGYVLINMIMNDDTWCLEGYGWCCSAYGLWQTDSDHQCGTVRQGDSCRDWFCRSEKNVIGLIFFRKYSTRNFLLNIGTK